MEEGVPCRGNSTGKGVEQRELVIPRPWGRLCGARRRSRRRKEGREEVRRRTREDSGRTPRVKGPELWSSGQLEVEELRGIVLLRGEVTNVCFWKSLWLACSCHGQRAGPKGQIWLPRTF